VWLKGAIGDWIGGLIADSQAGHLIDLNYALRLLADHRNGVADHSRKVWAVGMFCLWHAIEIERVINPAPPHRNRSSTPLAA
jgi:asparagine synthase (glutamine-hydrolysing)